MQKNNGTVLIIEDKVIYMIFASTLFENLGYKVLTAINVIKAIEIIEKGPKLNLLFIDVTSSRRVNGITLARAVRNLAPSFKIILSSSYSIAQLEEDYGNFDEFTFLKKPYRLSEMVMRIGEVCSEQIINNTYPMTTRTNEGMLRDD